MEKDSVEWTIGTLLSRERTRLIPPPQPLGSPPPIHPSLWYSLSLAPALSVNQSSIRLADETDRKRWGLALAGQHSTCPAMEVRVPVWSFVHIDLLDGAPKSRELHDSRQGV